MTNVKSKKSNIHCESHRCKVCHKSLYEYSATTRIVFTSIMFLVMASVVILSSYLDNKQTETCYERQYISGRGTDTELVRAIDVKCPN